ncbi:hypothetical protein YB2330_002894 [Saitoella coloradoensis]
MLKNFLTQYHDYLPPHSIYTSTRDPAVYTNYLRLFQLFPFVAPVVFVIDAPHGRFSLQNSKLNIPGRWGWMLMELVSPLTFLSTYFSAPAISGGLVNYVLVASYLLHYANRAVIGPVFRAPSMKPMHVSVFGSAVLFNYINGLLLGAYFASSPRAHLPNTQVAIGRFLWTVGFIGNFYHDEILYSLRRPKQKGENQGDKNAQDKEGYSIPHGGLYSLISVPSYFCEWIEWTGFALASTPLSWAGALASAPLAFIAAEVGAMLPRAWKTDRWYREKFGKDYPEGRKAVIPYVF